MTRRDFYKVGTVLLSGLVGSILAVPGVAFVLSPLRKGAKGNEGFDSLTRLSQLKVGEPQSFTIFADTQDAWVRYPKEPIGIVWVVREEEGGVKAFTASCPHLNCPVKLTSDGKGFVCPCHVSEFDFDGKPKNDIPPRPMDRLEVDVTKDSDPIVKVKFERFQPRIEEKIPLV